LTFGWADCIITVLLIKRDADRALRPNLYYSDVADFSRSNRSTLNIYNPRGGYGIGRVNVDETLRDLSVVGIWSVIRTAR